ncbi:MAG: pantoate--beta-alanine ligase [Alphaproteobacteria bacterium]|nr:pantoate--beta-alanine ligase [Alphaproteobacteria bacterium]
MSISSKVSIVRSVTDLRSKVAEWRTNGLRIGFVPTMGALHEGHLSLVREALKTSDRVAVSIFVNPTQFGPNEDFEKYPRRESEDCARLEEAGAHLVFVPSVDEMYPEGSRTTVRVGEITERLEGAFRPGHFEGVTTVVAKLLLQCLPDIAVFGEKDYQQLAVIRRMVDDLCIPVEIVGAPIVRDERGLALSSRNAYLTPEGLKTARLLNRVLASIALEMAKFPAEIRSLCEMGTVALLESGFDEVDYFELVDAVTLERLPALDRTGRLVATVRLEGVRLLDNIAVDPGVVS